MKKITVRLSEPEYLSVFDSADAKGVSMNEYMKQAVLQKNHGEVLLKELNETREDVRFMLDQCRSEIGMLHSSLAKSMQLANEDLENKMGVEVDRLQAMLYDIFKKLAGAGTEPADTGNGSGKYLRPMPIPSSRP